MIQVYYLLHVVSGFLLTAATFQAFAAPTPERRRGTQIAAGVFSLLMLTGGFGLLARLDYSFAPWVYVKIGCWVALSAMAGLAFRRPQLAGRLTILTALIIVTAVWSVYYKPGVASFAG